MRGRPNRTAPGAPPNAPPRRWPRPLRPGSLLALLLYVGLAVWITQGAWRASGSALACANVDCVQATWFLGWVCFAVAHLRDPLTTTYLTPPGDPIGLMWNNAAPLLGVLLAPLTAAAGALVSYNVGIVAGLAGSAWSASLVVGRVTRHAFPAFVAGLIFGFSPWMLGEVRGGHLFLVSLWLMPPYFLLLVRVLVGDERVRLRSGILLGGLLAAQLLISQEVLADALLIGVVAAIGLACASRHSISAQLRITAPRVAAASAAFVALAGVPLAVALTGPGHHLHGRLENPSANVADLFSLVVPRAWELLAPFGAAALTHRFGGLFGVAYLGVPLLAVVAWAWWRYRVDPWVRGSVLLVAVAIVLSLGPVLRVDGVAFGPPLPWTLLLRLPVYGLLVPARIAPFAFLGAAVCVAMVLDRLWPDRSDARLAWPATVAAAVLLPLVPAGPVPVWLAPVPGYFVSRTLPGVPNGSLIAIAAPPAQLGGVDAMLWQVDADFRFRLAWGYAIQSGPGGRASGLGRIGPLQDLWLRLELGSSPRLTTGRADAIRKDLWRWRVRALVVGPVPHRALLLTLASTVLREAPQWRDGVAIWLLDPGHGAVPDR